jgi:hypothetical protein
VPRQSTGKRTRFEVFKRDSFTCQYCGAQPPAVVLVLDHIHPVAAGGESTPENLITACEPCNQGKADRQLGDRIVRPDADLMYLSTQQEVAELRRYQEELARREAAMDALVEELQDSAWFDVSALTWCPGDKLVRQMLNKYSPTITAQAMRITAQALDQKRVPGYFSGAGTAWQRYLWGVARNIAAQEEED